MAFTTHSFIRLLSLSFNPSVSHYSCCPAIHPRKRLGPHVVSALKLTFVGSAIVPLHGLPRPQAEIMILKKNAVMLTWCLAYAVL